MDDSRIQSVPCQKLYLPTSFKGKLSLGEVIRSKEALQLFVQILEGY